MLDRPPHGIYYEVLISIVKAGGLGEGAPNENSHMAESIKCKGSKLFQKAPDNQ